MNVAGLRRFESRLIICWTLEERKHGCSLHTGLLAGSEFPATS